MCFRAAPLKCQRATQVNRFLLCSGSAAAFRNPTGRFKSSIRQDLGAGVCAQMHNARRTAGQKVGAWCPEVSKRLPLSNFLCRTGSVAQGGIGSAISRWLRRCERV